MTDNGDVEGTEAVAVAMVAVLVEQVQDVEMAVDWLFMFSTIARERGEFLFLRRVLDPSVG